MQSAQVTTYTHVYFCKKSYLITYIIVCFVVHLSKVYDYCYSIQAVGQRLMELGIFTEIQGGNHFVVSSVVYYQFCSSTRVNARAVSSSQGTR